MGIISIKVEGLDELKKSLTDLQKEQLQYALARALTKIATNVKKEEISEMKTSLDRPTPYTLGSLYTQSATKNNLTSIVAFKDKSSIASGHPASSFIAPQIEGGARATKGFENALMYMGILPRGYFITPAKGYALDPYGNIPTELITEIISYFQSHKQTTKSLYGNLWGIKETGYFAVNGKTKTKLSFGIYKASSVGRKKKVQLVMKFINRIKYQKRLPFFDKAYEYNNQNFRQIFNEAMTDALNTAR